MWNARLTSPLFNTEQYAHDLEKVYWRMWNKYKNEGVIDHQVEPFE